MTQQLLQEASNSFVRGLITEASPLTFPKDASADELNCDLKRTGARCRRLAIEYESNFSLSDITVSNTSLVTTGLWRNVGGQAGENFLVVQVDNQVFFYKLIDDIVSTKRVATSLADTTPYVIDLTTYERQFGQGARAAEIEVTSVRGSLIIASHEINTILVQRDVNTEVFTVSQIDFRVRDFTWLGDRSSYDRPDTAAPSSEERAYDTFNSGWTAGLNSSSSATNQEGSGTDALNAYVAARSVYPPLTHPWYSGKDSDGAFSVTEWEKVYSGTSLIANGHYILGLFDKNRQAVSGLTLPSETEDSRFSTVATFAGRVFYSGIQDSNTGIGSGIYFSPVILDDFSGIGDCFQLNDPTSEEISDILETDGGYISIPDAFNIKRLFVTGTRLLVFAENGVWGITGVDQVFRANEFIISKISDVGLEYKRSFVGARDKPFWWHSDGIYTLNLDPSTGTLVDANLSESTIQTRWEAIGSDEKDKVKSFYDPEGNTVYWLYPSDNETIANKKNNLLVLNLNLQAFYPWLVVDEAVNTNYIVEGFHFAGSSRSRDSETVTSGGVDVTANGELVVSDVLNFVSSVPQTKYLVVDGDTGSLTFANFSSRTFLDWGSANYSSYAETYHNFVQDLTTRKYAYYVTTYFNLTETGWTGDYLTGYTPLNPSSCLLSNYWDLKTNPSTGTKQAYRLGRTPIVDPSDLTSFPYPTSMVQTKLRVRGSGKTMRLRYESEQGKDFQLLGYEVVYGKNTRV